MTKAKAKAEMVWEEEQRIRKIAWRSISRDEGVTREALWYFSHHLKRTYGEELRDPRLVIADKEIAAWFAGYAKRHPTERKKPS
jgi:hypothetical protein